MKYNNPSTNQTERTNISYRKKIGHYLRLKRIESGFQTEEYIAKEAGLSQSVLSRIENGSYEPLMLRHIEKLATAYGIAIEDVFRNI